MKGRRFGISVSVAGCLMFDAYKTRAVLFPGGCILLLVCGKDETTNWKQRHMSRNEKRGMNRLLLRPPTVIVSDAQCDSLQS